MRFGTTLKKCASVASRVTGINRRIRKRIDACEDYAALYEILRRKNVEESTFEHGLGKCEDLLKEKIAQADRGQAYEIHQWLATRRAKGSHARLQQIIERQRKAAGTKALALSRTAGEIAGIFNQCRDCLERHEATDLIARWRKAAIGEIKQADTLEKMSAALSNTPRANLAPLRGFGENGISAYELAFRQLKAQCEKSIEEARKIAQSLPDEALAKLRALYPHAQKVYLRRHVRELALSIPGASALSHDWLEAA